MGSLNGQVRDRFRRAIAEHRALAVVIGTVVLFGCAMTSPLIKDPGSLSPAEFTDLNRDACIFVGASGPSATASGMPAQRPPVPSTSGVRQ